MKYQLRNVRHPYLIPSKEVMDLAMLVAKDYERRMLGDRPDRWHWADSALFHYGWIVDLPH